MDDIYRNASITIINAAGTGPNSGLPGVSDSFRRLPTMTTIDVAVITSVLRVKSELLRSEWSTRGCK